MTQQPPAGPPEGWEPPQQPTQPLPPPGWGQQPPKQGQPPGQPGLRQSRGMHPMSEYACRRNLPSDLDQRRHVALARDVGLGRIGRIATLTEPWAFIPGAVTRTRLERANPVHRAGGQPSGYRMRDLTIDLPKNVYDPPDVPAEPPPAGSLPEICQKLRYAQPHVAPLPIPRQHRSPARLYGGERS
jgi:hypothetical protein